MADVTAIVLTLNEEKNIESCIRSVAGFCKRVVIVDSGSTDRTLEI
ncbi:MAG TPA: glycosyltransferase, partial [Clostridia bacterium]|nr:glycosyltransferase [Clostridia bacterium]